MVTRSPSFNEERLQGGRGTYRGGHGLPEAHAELMAEDVQQETLTALRGEEPNVKGMNIHDEWGEVGLEGMPTAQGGWGV